MLLNCFIIFLLIHRYTGSFNLKPVQDRQYFMGAAILKLHKPVAFMRRSGYFLSGSSAWIQMHFTYSAEIFSCFSWEVQRSLGKKEDNTDVYFHGATHLLIEFFWVVACMSFFLLEQPAKDFFVVACMSFFLLEQPAKVFRWICSFFPGRIFLL